MDLTTDNIKIRRLGRDDTQIAGELFLLLQEIFEVENITTISNIHLTKLLENPAFFAYAAFYENELAGGLTAYELAMYDAEGSNVYIYDIAVTPRFRRKGIGKRLLAEILQHCVQNGINELFVQANKEDDHALDFYRSTGAAEEPVIQFTYRQRR